MSGVKQSSPFVRLLPLLAGLAAAAGCARNDLLRFAPPGIVKYEEIAGDQPVNPAVAARIEAYKKDPATGGFPNLSEAPGPEDRPKKLPAAETKAQKSALEGARDALASDVVADRAAADAELAADIATEREALREQVEKDSAAAARERREKLVAPPVDENDEK